jgi:hypothetical protein
LLPIYNFLFAVTRKNRELFFFSRCCSGFVLFYISSNHLPAKNTQFDFICQRRLCASRGGQEESSTARAQAARCDVDSPVRATQIRARERRAGRPAAAPREGEHALPWWLALPPVLSCRSRRARPPLRPIVQRADCSTGTAWRATSRSSASRIHQCGHPSITCCTVACSIGSRAHGQICISFICALAARAATTGGAGNGLV